MNGWQIRKIWFCLAIATLAFSFSVPVRAQENSSATEVYLSFQYRGIISVYATAYYKDDQFYLPVSELFRLLKINHEVHQGELSISGSYLGEKDFLLDFLNFSARSGDKEIQLQAEDFIIGEIDYFVRPFVFKQLFGLAFTTDFSNLTLDLQTSDKMPVIVQYEREQKRQQLSRDESFYERDFHPLKYERDYSPLDGAFLDYSLSAVYSGNSQLFTFSNAIGGEFFAGDVQGNIYGAISGQQSDFTTNGLRWRYVKRNSDYFSSIIAGQTSSEGIGSRSFTGLKISNKPVEPRLLFDRYVIDGNVPAQSEVELYLNNRLIDYQEADQAGNYRFVVPLTYGSTNYSVRTFTPSGQLIEESSRIQIPFDYLPPGEVDYSVSAGQLDNPILGSANRNYMGEATLSAGLTEWLTAKASSEYLTNYHRSTPSFTGTINARLFSNYLLSADINSENFYRLTSSVVYKNGASWSLSYDYNPGNSRLYNVGGSGQQARLNLFMPFQIGMLPLNIRWASTYQKNGLADLLRYRADLNTRLGRLNVRFGYQDQQAGNFLFAATSASRLTNSYTYSLGRFNNIPNLFRGMFIRGQLSYLPGLDEFEEMEFQLSRDFMQTGRIQLSYGHNFLGDFSSLSLNLTVDFDKIRSNTTTRVIDSEASFTQSVRGSVAYDSYGGQIMLNNRQQVGQSGAAVRLFVDKNNDGSYQEGTDNLINNPAVRFSRAGGRTSVKNGINYISQLLPYYRYDIEINRSALANPLLVPAAENFSIITDPNQYKPIEIPFYLSGVISGRVKREGRGLSGVRLYLESQMDSSSTRRPVTKELRTFSDGSFYTYEIPPGEYNLYIDPNQLKFLDAVSRPDTMRIEIEALARGDFVEGLNFTVSAAAESPIVQKPESENYYQVQIGSFSTLSRAKNFRKIKAEKLGDSLRIIYNRTNGLYAVRMPATKNRNDAKKSMISYYKSGNFSDAALVILKDTPESYSISKSKFIQIGAFSTKERAEAFVSSAEPKLKREVLVSFNEEINLYKVLINNVSRLSMNDLRRFLGEVRMKSFDDAFIYEDNIKGFNSINFSQREMEFSSKIRIEGLLPESEKAVLALLNKQRGLEVQHPEENVTEINNFESWKEILQIHKNLWQISGAEPIIMLKEKGLPKDTAK